MKYRVQMRKVLWTSVEVEADDPDEAIDKAYEGNLPTLCAQCSGWGQPWYVDDGEWGVPDEMGADDLVEEVAS